ncbi:MAG: hypothetical protein K2P61_02215 [Burkholderiaceae bacterium]|nr:hypothetical protein [Burkholderiaceae bacterium]
MSVLTEFETVDLIVLSKIETRGVDSFALSLIKAERQLRKLFTHLVFQFPCFTDADVPILRKTLASNRKVYFEGFEKGINNLAPVTVEKLIGPKYAELRPRLAEAIAHRNKIFHGQLTEKNLSRDELLAFVSDIRSWCILLGTGATECFGYDGLERNSFQKGRLSRRTNDFRESILSADAYAEFIKSHVER